MSLAPTCFSAAQPTLTHTSVHVLLTVERQEITPGPYARYANKYLGVQAPLADKVSHNITVAKISKNSELQIVTSPAETSVRASHMDPESGFPKLPVDRISASPRNSEESARAAAEKIFDIRRSRYELITGDAGENVFGAGLASAIAELNRLEEKYLSLFLGIQTTTTITTQYEIIPSSSTLNYIVCRFSSADGLLPKDDLSGTPVVLELKPSAPSTEGLDIVAKPTSKSLAYRIPADVECRIILDGAELTSATVPLYQFGKTVYLAM